MIARSWRLFACLSGICFGVGVMFVLEAIEDMFLGNVSDSIAIALVNAALVVGATLLLRNRKRRVANWIAYCASATAIIFAILATAIHWGARRTIPQGADAESDLQKLVIAQRQFRRDSGRYTATLPPGVRMSPGVQGPTITLTSDGWTAMTSQITEMPRVCSVFVGSTPMPPAETEGVVACTSSSSGMTDPDFPTWILLLAILGASFGALARWLARHEPGIA